MVRKFESICRRQLTFLQGGELPIGQGSMQQPPTTSIVGERAQAVTAESGQDQQPSIDSLSEPRLTPTSKSPKKLPYRPADYIVQNLPPKTSDVSSNEPLILQTEKFLNLAYAWGQLELAKSALANAHDILMGIEKGELPVSTPKQRMREVRAIPKDMLVLVEEGEGGGEEKAEAE